MLIDQAKQNCNVNYEQIGFGLDCVRSCRLDCRAFARVLMHLPRVKKLILFIELFILQGLSVIGVQQIDQVVGVVEETLKGTFTYTLCFP